VVAGARVAGRWARCPAGFLFFYFVKFSLPRAICALSTCAPRGSGVALGKGAFAGWPPPSGLCREVNSLYREDWGSRQRLRIL
jgi:hypothetical protein